MGQLIWRGKDAIAFLETVTVADVAEMKQCACGCAVWGEGEQCAVGCSFCEALRKAHSGGCSSSEAAPHLGAP